MGINIVFRRDARQRLIRIDAMTLYMGMPHEFWAELKEWSDDRGYTDLIQEVATLRSKISFYESRIDQMANFMKIRIEVKQ